MFILNVCIEIFLRQVSEHLEACKKNEKTYTREDLHEI